MIRSEFHSAVTAASTTMITIKVHHDYCIADFEADPEEFILLQSACSYKVKDAERSPLFQDGIWDGFKSLFKKTRNQPQGKFPSGILPFVVERLKSSWARVHIDDLRVFYRSPNEIRTDNLGYELRDYQLECATSMLVNKRGIVRLPTATGKTKTAISLINTLQMPTLWLTHESALAAQTVAVFQESLFEPPVAFYRTNQPDIALFTVGLVKSLFLNKDRLQKWLDQILVLVIDECHHGSAKMWYEVAMALPNAQYRLGVSATPFERSDDAHLELIGSTGPMIFTRDVEQLKSHVARPKVTIFHLPKSRGYPIVASEWSTLYEKGICEHDLRNQICLEHAMNCVQKRQPCILFVSRLSHGEYFRDQLAEQIGVNGLHVFISGQTPQDERTSIYNRLRRGELFVLVAMDKVAGEGQDIPAVKKVIMAGGMKGSIGTKQRTGRGMRRTGDSITEEGWGGEVEIIDFADNHHWTLQQQASIRRGTYIEIGAEVFENYEHINN